MDYDLQKQLATARMTHILGNADRAQLWMRTLQEDFQTTEGMWRTANEMIERGDYDKVMVMIARIEGGVY
jgi:hypothetical protein